MKSVAAPKKSQMRILGFMLANLARKFTQLELARGIGQGKSYKNVREGIRELAEQGIISTEAVGASVLCWLNLGRQQTVDYISFVENSRKYELFRKVPLLQEISERFIEQIKLHTPFFSLLLFGSYAKGTFHEKSDIDLIVIAESKHRKAIEKEATRLQALYSAKISVFALSRKDYEAMLRGREAVNVGKESLKGHILLYGAEFYYQIVRDALWQETSLWLGS